ncbi:hypothetical protein J31TS6_52270 [Brevibacillus reuszeri]|nr:hypothetical protein [Brevibacillus reuszeri]GIO09199.1 hypothetical protein J31TS6_52270 [Brevibacillus reuszeri]
MRLLDTYVELGVVAMARAATAGWFGGTLWGSAACRLLHESGV